MIVEWATQGRQPGFRGWDAPRKPTTSEADARREFEERTAAYARNGYGEVRLLRREITDWEDVGHGNCWADDGDPWHEKNHGQEPVDARPEDS